MSRMDIRNVSSIYQPFICHTSSNKYEATDQSPTPCWPFWTWLTSSQCGLSSAQQCELCLVMFPILKLVTPSHANFEAITCLGGEKKSFSSILKSSLVHHFCTILYNYYWSFSTSQTVVYKLTTIYNSGDVIVEWAEVYPNLPLSSCGS
jgi:hypothetical protein